MMRGAALLGLLLLGACGGPACRTHSALYLGTALGNAGEMVAVADWQAFVAAEIAPRFPDGFTVVDAAGQYRSPSTGLVVTEPTRILMLVHDDKPVVHAAIDAIAAAYKSRFRQEAVLRVDQCAAFAL